MRLHNEAVAFRPQSRPRGAATVLRRAPWGLFSLSPQPCAGFRRRSGAPWPSPAAAGTASAWAGPVLLAKPGRGTPRRGVARRAVASGGFNLPLEAKFTDAGAGWG